MNTYTDQIKRRIAIDIPPKRIISLVPSITEFVWDVGMKKELVGRTKFCIHPKDAMKQVSIVGGTKTIHLDRIDDLGPDLIIANKEENNKEQIEELIKKYPVFVSDVPTFEKSLDLITRLGDIFNKEKQATGIIYQLRQKLLTLQSQVPKRVAYLIWQKPYMTVGRDTYIHDMLLGFGYENIFNHKTRYPETSIEELQQLQPDVIMLSSEPFPFKQKHISELQDFFPKQEICLVNGELFSWYGTRLLNL